MLSSSTRQLQDDGSRAAEQGKTFFTVKENLSDILPYTEAL